MTMAAGIDGEAAPPRKTGDHLIPAAPVEPGRVAKEDRWIFAGPFPKWQSRFHAPKIDVRRAFLTV
jgi:hypothetical protein